MNYHISNVSIQMEAECKGQYKNILPFLVEKLKQEESEDNNMFNWTEILEKNKERILETLEEAFRDAVNNRHMEFIVEIDKDGDIRQWGTNAGSMSMSMSVFHGEACEVGRFCFQYLDIDITEDDVKSHLSEGEFQTIELLAKEEFMGVVSYIYSDRKYHELVNKIEDEWFEWYKDEYSYESALELFNQRIEAEEYLLERKTIC